MENKTIEEIQNEVAKDIVKREWTDIYDVLQEEYFNSWEDLINSDLDINEFWLEVCKRYATECCKVTLNKAAYKMEYSIEDNGYTGTRLLRSAITDESNITLL